MAKTDWTLTDTVKPDDFNNIGREINQLRTDVDHIEVPPASLTEAGIVQLSNATNSTSEAQAATSKAVKAAYDTAAAAQTTANAANSAAAAAFHLGNERKAEVVAALVALGISASTTESWDSLVAKLTAIVKRGAQVITPGTTNKAIPVGYHNGNGYVVGEPNLIAGNLPKDKSFFGIFGALERMTTAEKQAIAAAITGKGVPAAISDTNTVLAQKIGQISTGIKVATGSFSGLNTYEPSGIISNLPFTPKVLLLFGNIRVRVSAGAAESYGYLFAHNINGSPVTGRLRVTMSSPEWLTAFVNIESINFGTNNIQFTLEFADGYGDISQYIVFGV